MREWAAVCEPSLSTMADWYGVSRRTISRTVRGETLPDVPGPIRWQAQKRPPQLSPYKGRAVLQRLREGETQGEVAERYGISQGTVSCIARGESGYSPHYLAGQRWWWRRGDARARVCAWAGLSREEEAAAREVGDMLFDAQRGEWTGISLAEVIARAEAMDVSPQGVRAIRRAAGDIR